MQLNAPRAVADKLTRAQRKEWHQLLHSGPDAVSTSQWSWCCFHFTVVLRPVLLCSATVLRQPTHFPHMTSTDWRALLVGPHTSDRGQAKAKLPQQVVFMSLRKYFLRFSHRSMVFEITVCESQSLYGQTCYVCVSVFTYMCMGKQVNVCKWYVCICV